MRNLITSQQVVNLAFTANDSLTPASINDTKIDAAQEKYLRPALGELFNALTAGKYPELLDEFIRPSLAYFVRYTTIPDIALRLNDKGAMAYTSDHANTATDKQRTEMRQQAKDDANTFLNKAIRYIEANIEKYPEYTPTKDVKRQSSYSGGIIL